MNVIKQKSSRLFFLLGGFFIANALIAELIGVKIFALEDTLGIAPWNFNLFGQQGALQFSAGVLLWPAVFVMTDIINEYYGIKGVRFLSYLTMGLIAYAFVMIFGAIHLAPADWWQVQYQSRGVPDMQAAFQSTFGQGLLIIMGSIMAFLVAQMVDVFSFHWIKKATGEKKLWLRATGSTIISQFFDSFVVLFVAFKLGPSITGTLKPWSWSLLFAVGTVQYVYKFLMAIIMTPVIYWIHRVIEKYLGEEMAQKMKTAAAK